MAQVYRLPIAATAGFVALFYRFIGRQRAIKYLIQAERSRTRTLTPSRTHLNPGSLTYELQPSPSHASSPSSRRSWPRPGRSSTGTGASTLGCSQRTARSGTSWNRRLHFSAPCGCTLHSSTQTCPGWVGLRLLYPVLLGAKLSNMQSKRVYLSTLPQYCIVAYLNTATLAKAFPAFSPWLAFLGFWAVFIGLGQFPRSLFET
eukprot:TRINITY_DN3462_c0_g1_i4.p1 TRINITY_DN3462_c0_g1~~TRINITY_DN3462_c0_g1_i4.p1  ORF type:complete len:203 (-),score=16.83 TRINITY_DN3462_c0_g1_i4:336-944(-)